MASPLAVPNQKRRTGLPARPPSKSAEQTSRPVPNQKAWDGPPGPSPIKKRRTGLPPRPPSKNAERAFLPIPDPQRGTGLPARPPSPIHTSSLHCLASLGSVFLESARRIRPPDTRLVSWHDASAAHDPLRSRHLVATLDGAPRRASLTPCAQQPGAGGSCHQPIPSPLPHDLAHGPVRPAWIFLYYNGPE
jgi:hypothetical protein